MKAAERAQQVRDQLQFLFALDTLEYLRKGGRIGGAQAWLGTALKIKPILSLDSEIGAVERVRTSRKAFERLVKLAPSGVGDDPAGKVLETLELDLVGDRDRLACPGKQHEQPAGVHPPEPEYPSGHRIQAVEIKEQPAIGSRLRERLAKLSQIDHS